MTFRGVVGHVVETCRHDGGVSIEWRIPNFLSLDGEGGDYYQSPDFGACEEFWCFGLYPHGGMRRPPSPWVNLFLFKDGYAPKTADVTLGIRGPEGVRNRRRRRQEISTEDDTCFWNRFCLRSKLAERKSRLMLGKVLVFSLDMKMDPPSVARDASSQTDEKFGKAEVLTEEKKLLEKQGIEKLSEDIGKLLVDDEDSNVTVQVGDVEFKTHKNILSVRSPVLSAMFRHQTEERATNRISVCDCEPGVFKQYLHFLYTGSVELLTHQNAFGLHTVADKYLADDLKQQCLIYIQNTLSVQTFCDTVKLALAYGQRDLLEQAINFATQNLPFIIRSVEWQHFNCEFPTEANEILIKCIKP